MENFYLSALLTEIRPIISDKTLARISLVGSSLLFDFRLPKQAILRASFDASSPALYLAQPERESANEAHPFLATLRKELAGAKLINLYKPRLERIVLFEFEGFDASGEKILLILALALTGRSANAYLLDSNRVIKATLNNRGRLRVNDDFSFDERSFDPQQLLKDLPDDATEAEVVERLFKSGNLFSPMIEKEFVARCKEVNPPAALTSLLADLTQISTKPIIYSKLPFEEIGKRKSNLKTDLLLSHFPLQQARNQNFIERQFNSLSEAASSYYRGREQAKGFQDRLSSLTRLLTDEIKKRAGLLAAIEGDKAKYADPEHFKQMGDLLLANISTAQIKASKATVIDYYDPEQPQIEIELGEGKTLQQASTAYFTQFQKARRALEAIAAREAALKPLLEKLRQLHEPLDQNVSLDQLELIKDRAEQLLGVKKKNVAKTGAAKKPAGKKPSGRWYLSASGFEIVVGRNDRDNDTITFRVAGSQDIWMHAADYPGSHVVIRNPNRKEVPVKVIQEAAEIAAFYSQAKQQDKVAVHYTQKKFVTKPPRSKPGLVRLSSFKTILVEPRCLLERIER
jgi:predicted ribosome quality control (RQC) complex YloA/Tae2 family protein